VRDSWRNLRDVLQVRRNDWLGVYRVAPTSRSIETKA